MALNDPNWGRRGNSEGPPDLDELWRKLTQKLNKLLGGRGTGGPTEPGGPSLFARLPGGAGLVVAIAIALWLASGFYIVDASQRGVVLRFGKYLETTQPGLQWHIPFPVESAEIVNVSQVRTVEVGYRANVKSKVLKESLMLTDDENIIDLQFAVQYLVKNPEDFLFNNRNPDEAVMQAAETAIREVVGKSKMDFVLYEGREQVAASVQKLLQEILDRYQTGIEVSKVTMQNAQPPEQVQAAFDDAVKASQDRERLKNEGQAYANDVIPRAAGMASPAEPGGRGLSPAGHRKRRGRREPVPPGVGRVSEGPGGHARPNVPRHDAADLQQRDQGPGRPEGRKQPADASPRQADPDVERQHGRNRYRAEAAHGARGHPANGHHESVAGSVSRP